MEYRNLHHHSQNQLQEQVINGQSSLPILHTDRITTSTGNSWNPSFNFLNNNGSSIVYPNGETMAYSRLWPSLSSPLITTQDLMISYNTTSDHHNHHDDHTRGFDHQRSPSSTNDHEPKVLLVKEEPPDSFSKLKINITPPNNNYYSDIEKSNYLFSTLYNNKPNHHQISDHQDFYSFIQAQSNNNNSASYGASFKGSHRYDHDDDHGQLGHNRTSSSLLCTTPLMLNSSSSSNGGFNSLVQANLDLLISPTSTTTQSCSPSSHNSSANYNNNLSLYSQTSSTSFGHGTGHHDMQEYSRSSPSNSSNMTTSTFLNEVTRTKRPSSSSFSEPKEYSRAESKKSKSMLRTSSNPPLKVRKEKLGDRIAALHRLVAPFGKTDTASVLTEAIGYIQFLHDQVQTLSMPYMKSLQQTKPSGKIQQVHGLSNEEETELNKVDLRSRGLCLVPLSCASYLNGFD